MSTFFKKQPVRRPTKRKKKPEANDKEFYMGRIDTELLKKQLWVLYHYSGLRAICSLAWPKKNKELSAPGYRKPATFVLWLLGTYTALFGIASGRYEMRVNMLLARANALIAQTAIPEACGAAIEQMPAVQYEECPVKPEFWNPFSVFYSAFFKNKNSPQCLEIAKILRNTIVTNQKHLSGIILRNAFLQSAHFKNLNATDSTFVDCDFKNSTYYNCFFLNSRFVNADFNDVKMRNVNFSHTKFYNTVFSSSTIEKTSLNDVYIRKGEFIKTKLNNVDFKYATIYETIFQNCTNGLIKSSFVLSYNPLIFKNSTLHNIIFFNSYFSGAQIENCYIHNCKFNKSTLDASEIKYSTVKQSAFINTQITNSCLNELKILNTTIKNLNLYKTNATMCNFLKSHKDEINYSEPEPHPLQDPLSKNIYAFSRLQKKIPTGAGALIPPSPNTNTQTTSSALLASSACARWRSCAASIRVW